MAELQNTRIPFELQYSSLLYKICMMNFPEVQLLSTNDYMLLLALQ